MTISNVKIIYMEEIKPDNKDFRIAELHIEGLSNPQIADALGINRSTVYRRLQTPVSYTHLTLPTMRTV